MTSRYLVIGATGAGKSTLARALAARRGLPYIDTDALFWAQGWDAPLPMHEVVNALPLGDAAWVLDGNFDDYRGEVWDAADTIVWLNYPFTLVLCRLIWRNGRWLFDRHTWTGRRMPPRRAWSGVRHLLRQYPRKRAAYPAFLQGREHQQILVFSHPNETAMWLAEFEATL